MSTHTLQDTSWIASLARQARELVQSHRVVETLPLRAGDNQTFKNVTYSYIAPCGVARSVQESTTTLLVARVDARRVKNRTTYMQPQQQQQQPASSYFWNALLESMFAVQGINGILPRYRYSPETTATSSDKSDDLDNSNGFYLPNTSIPRWHVFYHQNGTTSGDTTRYLFPNTSLASRAGLHSSGRVSALPLQATTVLDLFAGGKQTQDDRSRLNRYFERLFEYHAFLHDVVMRGCRKDKLPLHNNTNETETPCYNVIHPWETMLDRESPLWAEPWEQVERLVGATSIDDIPLFLAQCISNITAYCGDGINHDLLSEPSAGGRLIDRDCEDAILRNCPFAMLDVGYAAALLKSDVDLLRMAELLHEARPRARSFDLLKKIEQIQQWVKQSEYVLWKVLWNDDHASFLSRYIVFHANGTVASDSTFAPVASEWLETPVATNFMAEWSSVAIESQRTAMLSHMLQQDGNDSFACGSYPLWSTGGCRRDGEEPATIDPILNDLVSVGLRHGGTSDVGRYLADSTLRLVCGLENTVEDGSSDRVCDNVSFPTLYHAATGNPLARSTCDGSSTATAAVVLDLLLPELPRHFVPPPPIRTSWAIVLVVMELLVAASIAVSCLVMSLRMLRRLGDTTGSDDYVRMITPRYAEGYFFSATASFASSENDDEERGTNEDD